MRIAYIFKRLIAVFIIGILLFLIFGCKDDFQPSIRISDLHVRAEIFMNENELISVLLSSVGLSRSESIDSFSMIRDDSTGYFSAVWNTEESAFMTVFDADGNIFQGKSLEGLLGDVVGLEKLSQGRLIVLSEERARISRDVTTRYYCLSSEGEVQKAGVFESMNAYELACVTSDEESTIFTIFNDKMVVLNLDTEDNHEIKIAAEAVRSVAYMRDEGLFAINSLSGGNRALISINIQTGATQTIKDFSVQEEFSPEGLYIFEDTKIYLLSYTGLSVYDVKDKSLTLLFDSEEYDLSIYSEDVFFYCGENEFIIYSYHDIFYEPLSGLYYLSVLDHPEEVTVLRLGTLEEEVMVDVSSIAKLFRLVYPEYEVEIVYYGTYSEAYDSEMLSKARLEMLSDIIEGNAPDIYMLPSSEMSVLANRDLLYDLSSPVDNWIASHPDMYAENALLAPREQGAGAQYWIHPFFSVSGIVMETAYRDEVTPFSFEHSFAYADAKDLHAFAPQALWQIFPLIETVFIDFSSRETFFDSQECLSLIDSVLSSEAASPGEALMRYETFENFEDYVYLAQRYPSDITMSGYPDGSESKPTISGSIAFAVFANTSEEIAALEFMNFLLSATVQSLSFEMGVFEMPVRLASLREQNQKIIQQTFHHEAGNDVMESSVQSVDGTFISSSNQTLLREYHENRYWEDMFIEIVLSAEQYYLMDYMLLMIFSEETMPYYFGQKSWEDAMQVLQRRASIYVAENYG